MSDKNKYRIPDYEVQRQLNDYLRNSFYDERMGKVREGWLASRQMARTSPQFLYPTPVPPIHSKGGEKE